MAGSMSRMAKQELLASIQDRYQGSSRKYKGRIVDEFIAVLAITGSMLFACWDNRVPVGTSVWCGRTAAL